MLYCGWDGGGSKTTVCITDNTGTVINEGVFGPLNINGTSIDMVTSTIENCIEFMNLQPGGLSSYHGLVIGTAGISNPNAVKLIKSLIRKCNYEGNIQLLGDYEIALSGAINGPGAILISGTGSVCYCRNKAMQYFRSGGYGYLIDDVGSGYAIGRDILASVSHSFDGRGPETKLTELVFEKINIKTIEELISWLYSSETKKTHIAGLAPLLLPALADGDEAAHLIAEKAAQDLTSLAAAVCKKARLQAGEIALTGSIFKYYETIRKQTVILLQQFLPELKIIEPICGAAKGAADLARKEFSTAT